MPGRGNGLNKVHCVRAPELSSNAEGSCNVLFLTQLTFLSNHSSLGYQEELHHVV